MVMRFLGSIRTVKRTISNLGMIGSTSLIREQFFSYITIKINEMIYLMPCKQISGSQTESVIYIANILQSMHSAHLGVDVLSLLLCYMFFVFISVKSFVLFCNTQCEKQQKSEKVPLIPFDTLCLSVESQIKTFQIITRNLS